MRVPRTARISNQSTQKEINPDYSLEGLMMKLKLQYFGHLMQRANSLEKTLMLGKIEGRRRRGQQKMRWLDSINDSVVVSVSKLSGKDRKAWQLQSLGLQTAGHDLATEQQRQEIKQLTLKTPLISKKSLGRPSEILVSSSPHGSY